jgi:Icc-related predicted phosphoesterase
MKPGLLFREGYMDSKVKVHVVSDIHLEFTGMECALDVVAMHERDFLIVAGDLAEGLRGEEWLVDQCSYSPVVYVTGNHEYYGHDIDDIDKRFRQLAKKIPNFYFLQKDVIELLGLRIAGCTLWTDMQGLSGWERRQVEKSMTDFCGAITKRGTRLTADIAAGVNMDHRNWLMQQNDLDIVVTHHAPTWQSVTDYWRKHGPLLNPAFAGTSDDIIDALSPTYWIHGHMHSFLRYWHEGKVGGTQVLCNPRGYGGSYQERTGFNDSLIIKL